MRMEPHARQGRVVPDEVVREEIDEIEQAGDRLFVELHGRVHAVYGDAVLVEVGVGRKLPEPLLAREPQGDRAQVPAREARPLEPLVLAADGAARIREALDVELFLQVGVVFFGLAEVDRDLDTVLRRPREVLRNGARLHIV